MGIHGIYKEIGPGQRIALSKLAVEKFEETGRPLRIAIDVSIWLFQIQASKGGTNPALRTFYYRLLRLISLSIHPVFVFDGPNKPPFKRNKRTGPNVASIPEFLAKQLLKQFGFPIHLAPGEAEAECALLQREGIVDAVLSEDVDTLMFGSRITIRNWSPEGKTGKTPTHVNVYDAVATKNGSSGLDRDGMILVALMSGGDYVPEGIPGCGPKTACEAARAGFGADLCKIKKSDTSAMDEWRSRLQHELKTNQNKLFKRKHGTLIIPDDFPRLDILGYYTHPAVSNQAGLDKLRRSIKWDQELDFPGLRSFTYDAFDWVKLSGAKHFVRSLAPALLVRHLRLRGDSVDSPSDDVAVVEEEEAKLVKGIHGRRQHAVTDSTPELRTSFTPIELVNIDLDIEHPDDDQELDDDDDNAPLEMEDGEAEAGPKKRGPTKFDPTKPARTWVLETWVRVGVPLKVQDWEASLVKPKRTTKAKETSRPASKAKASKRAISPGAMPQASIQQFAKVTKPGARLTQQLAKAPSPPLPSQDAHVLPPRLSRDPPPASQPPSSRSATQNLISLLSSSPTRPKSPTFIEQKDNSLAPVLEELPASVTKRRKRVPIQRSHTTPADLSTSERPATPPLPSAIETLDLLSSPILPSPSQAPAKKAKTRRTQEPIARSRSTRETSITSTAGGKTKQTTLDLWASSQASSPAKSRRAESVALDRTPPRQPQLRRKEPELLDLTVSSPVYRPDPPEARILEDPATRHVISPSNPRRTAATFTGTRPPLRTITSNTSRTSTRSRSSDEKERSASSRQHSPRLIKSNSDIDALDLTQPSPDRTALPISTHTLLDSSLIQPQHTNTLELDVLDSTLLSSPLQSVHPTTELIQPPTPRRSPRNHKSSSPPAAWKAQAKKKREIVLRKSLVGSWDFVDAGVNVSPLKSGDGDETGRVLKGKERKRWRESEVEILDLVD